MKSQRFLVIAAFCGVALVAGCAQPPKAVVVEDAIEQTFIVDAVDYSTRLVTLRDGAGTQIIHAGPEVRNLQQVKVGDLVVVRYKGAIAAEVVKPGTGMRGVEATSAAARAAPGERPFAGAAGQVRMTVKVWDVDPYQHWVEVTGPRGYNRRMNVVDPDAQAFLHGLKRGDEVAVTLTEAIAISVEAPR